MAGDTTFEQKRFDPWIYIGILVFRWKLIVAGFLYCVLAGVLYLRFAPREYMTNAKIMMYRLPRTDIESVENIWKENQTHVGLLRKEEFRETIVESLSERWLPRLKNPALLRPTVGVSVVGGEGITIQLSICNTHPAYARKYLDKMIAEFRTQREMVKDRSSGSALRVLKAEMELLHREIRESESNVIEYQRANNMEYVQQKGSMELDYLRQLIVRQQQLSTERWMLEMQFPRLKGSSPELIRDFYKLTRETGDMAPPVPASGSGAGGTGAEKEGEEAGSPREKLLREMLRDTVDAGAEPRAKAPTGERVDYNDGTGWQDLRIRLARLERERKEQAVNMQPDHPKIRQMDEEMASIRKQIELLSEVEFARLKERLAAISLQTDALEEAQRKWKDSYLTVSKKTSELRRLQLVVQRLEMLYVEMFTRLNDVRVDQEIKGETFTILAPVKTQPTAVWPDPGKIIIAMLLTGLGTGLGLAIVAFVFDNKIQSISDVEEELGVTFLGGIPFWIHRERMSRIRPIVTDQHKFGASEAYRVLRTNVLAALEKAGRKVLLITSADSKEGKTLTTLNLAIMIANTGKRVLLIDTDLRRGVLHQTFEVDRTPGVVEALREGRKLSEVVVPTSQSNLWFAPAGALDKNTSELLQAVDLTAFLGEVAEQYDYVILDSAPVLRVTDSVILAGCPLCAVVYVVRANRTSKPFVKYSLDMLGDVQVIGMIVNSIEMQRISSLYYAYKFPNYAYYSYAYQYGDSEGWDGSRGPKLKRHRGEGGLKGLVDRIRRNLPPME